MELSANRALNVRKTFIRWGIPDDQTYITGMGTLENDLKLKGLTKYKNNRKVTLILEKKWIS